MKMLGPYTKASRRDDQLAYEILVAAGNPANQPDGTATLQMQSGGSLVYVKCMDDAQLEGPIADAIAAHVAASGWVNPLTPADSADIATCKAYLSDTTMTQFRSASAAQLAAMTQAQRDQVNQYTARALTALIRIVRQIAT